VQQKQQQQQQQQLLCDSPGSEERLHARAVRLLHFNAAKWLEERGFKGS
jgi:hypothetical protein